MKLGCTSKSSHLFPTLQGLSEYLRSKDVDMPFDMVTLSKDSDILALKKLGYSYIRMDETEAEKIASKIKILPENVRFSGIFDCLILENNQLLPRLFYFDYLRKFFVQKFKNHKINEAAVLLTNDVELKGFVTFALSLGHKKIIIVNQEGSVKNDVELRSFNMGMELEVIKIEDVTQINIGTSLMINTYDLKKYPSLLTDLAYFNFMTKQGIVIELESRSPVNPLLFEAEKAGLRSMGRREFISYYEFQNALKLGFVSILERDHFLSNYNEIMTID
ncbi:MAG: hypothetical protein L6Q37_07920 [Bdellovibrionaceae bacterium]|nr:hypothetical protein [Pseudobdellovibrionaceae bacterium]NUM59243.1 hypothetical protein [Pseudobdellovibrionaceae bacterium]